MSQDFIFGVCLHRSFAILLFRQAPYAPVTSFFHIVPNPLYPSYPWPPWILLKSRYQLYVTLTDPSSSRRRAYPNYYSQFSLMLYARFETSNLSYMSSFRTISLNVLPAYLPQHAHLCYPHLPNRILPKWPTLKPIS